MVRREADTNGDRKPDVVQTYRDGAVTHQDEDTDFDGVVDQRFEGQTPIAVAEGTAVDAESFSKIDCGSFHRFWWKR